MKLHQIIELEVARAEAPMSDALNRALSSVEEMEQENAQLRADYRTQNACIAEQHDELAKLRKELVAAQAVGTERDALRAENLRITEGAFSQARVNKELREELALEEQRIADLMAELNRVGHELTDDAGVIVHDNLSHPNDEALVMRNPPKLGISTLCRLMDDCLPEQIDDARDMQKLIDKLWPALCCEFDADA